MTALSALEQERKDGGLWFCPNWCQQDELEAEQQHHIGPLHAAAADGVIFRARAWMDWDVEFGEDDTGRVQIFIDPAPDLTEGELFTGEQLDALHKVTEAAREDLANPGDFPGTGSGKWPWLPAYPGAYQDCIDAQDG